MKAATIFLAALICLVSVQARHTERRDIEKATNDEQNENIGSLRDRRSDQMRHRRKRWQMNYGYDYPPPPNPYYPDRRDYDRNQDLIPQILRLLDEIAAYVRRPPPPPALPQPIYVPYPVPYPVPQPPNCTCNIQVSGSPNVTSRFPVMEDSNQNWGLTDLKEPQQLEDDGNDGARPISFEPIKPIRPVRPPPAVEHGSSQSGGSTSQDKQERAPGVSKSAGACNAAILSCCSDPQQRECFTRFGCSMTYSRNNVCSKESIAAAIQAFKEAYSPA